jgi:lactate dehydrogenase-like 2-hydroxyacid dehydrogenase
MNVITLQSEAYQNLIQTIHELHGNLQRRYDEIDQLAKAKKIWVNNEEASELLKVSKRTMQNYRDKGILGYAQIGKQVYYKLEDIENLLKKHYHKPKNTRYD